MTTLDNVDRLAALAASGLLEKDVQARLCHLAYTAAALTRADIAQVNVVDGTLQHHVCQWPPPANPDPRAAETSGCTTVVKTGLTLAITDTCAHPITCDLPWTDQYRGYLGTPILFAGQSVGALCVLSSTPRAWSAHDLLALEGVARLLMLSLDPPES